jgi:glycosyltransferase involved in cell wall biosynthesis
MKIGLYGVNIAATVGGGYVLRDDVARAALDFKGRHQFELINENAAVSTLKQSRLAQALARIARVRGVARSSRVNGLRQEIARRGIDVLWFNHLEPIDAGVPYVLNIFDLQHRLQPWFPEVSENGQWDHRESTWGRAIMRASIVTVGSDESARQVGLFYGVSPERIRVIPFPTPQPAIDAAHASAADKRPDVWAKYKIAGDYLFYPAQFWAHKNHVNLLRALRRLRDESGLLFTLVLTGSDQGNLAHVKATVAALGLQEQVQFLGFVPHEDVIELYRGAFALAYVSFFGPENLPPLEAMALGCPVVLAQTVGVETLFNDAAILVDPRDDSAIAAGIRQLKATPALRARCVASGRAIALQNTRATYVSKLHDVFDEFDVFRRCWR